MSPQATLEVGALNNRTNETKDFHKQKDVNLPLSVGYSIKKHKNRWHPSMGINDGIG